MSEQAESRESLRPTTTQRRSADGDAVDIEIEGEEVEGADRDEEERGEGDGEEGREVKTKRGPKPPSETEWRKHRITHLPFRAWCPECVAAKAADAAHPARRPVEESEVPECHWDYCFMRNKTGEKSVPVLVGKDGNTKCFFAHVVPGKWC